MKKNLNFLKSFIKNNVNPPEKGFATRFWPREMKIAKELLAKFPDEAFWTNFSIGFTVNSLAYFKMKDGEALLTRKYSEFHFKPENKTDNILPLSDRKFGETLHNGKAPKTLSDFLN